MVYHGALSKFKVKPSRPDDSAESASVSNHGGTDSCAGALVDEDHAAGHPVALVRVAEDRLGQPQRDPPDLVEAQLTGRVVPVQRVDVEPVLQVTDDRLNGPGRVLG